MANNKKRDISDNELYRAQKINNFFNDFNDAMKKKILHDVKNYLVWAIPGVILFGCYFIFNQFILLALAMGCIGVPVIIKPVKEILEDIKSFRNPNYKPKDGFEEVDKVLSLDLTKRPEDFYREDLKKALSEASSISSDERKYYELVAQQKEERIKTMQSKSALEIAVLDDFSHNLENYDMLLCIEEEDFKKIFDSIYSYLQFQDMTDNYYELLDLIMRTVVQNALAIENKIVTLENFTSSFRFLLEEGFVSDYKDIDVLFQEINQFIKERESVFKAKPQKSKIIQFKPKSNK